MWTLEEAVDVVRTIQTLSRDFGYHVALGGGVVNEGYSEKDIDIYFLPLDGDEYDPLRGELDGWLEEIFGPLVDITPADNPKYSTPAFSQYRRKVMGDIDGKRVDIFVL